MQFVVGLGDKVSPNDIEEGMHVKPVNKKSPFQNHPFMFTLSSREFVSFRFECEIIHQF